MIQAQNAPKKSRIGCVARFWLMVGAACLFLLAFQAVFMPWGFYLGGHFHWIPWWEGVGVAHAPNGRDYAIFVSIYPDARHSGRYSTSLTGSGYLCTPKGEKMQMKLSANMDKHLDLDTQGKTIRISMHRTSTWSTFINSDYSPSIQLNGIWGDDSISGEDHNSFGRAFEPDGSVYLGRSPTRGPSFATVSFTLKAGSMRDFEKACSAL